MAKTWIEGVSRTSIGRFGGLRDDCIPYNDGYLTCSATATDVFLQHDNEQRVDLGHYLLPADVTVRTRAHWCGRRYDFAYAGGRPHSTVFRSLLFPGFLHRVKDGKWAYYWRIRGYSAGNLILPLEGGLRYGKAVEGYDRKRDGDLAKPWVLFSFANSQMPFDYPMQLVFDRQPERIEVWTHEYVKVFFSQRQATIVQIHPFGAQRLDKDITAWWKDGLHEDILGTLDFWAAAAMAYPTQCRETFQVDEKRRVVRIRDEYRYETFKSQWKIRPIQLAPLPPILANARNFGYPIAIKGKLRENLCPTFHGWYEAVQGDTIEYELPLSRFRDHTLAPVMIRNNALAEQITSRLNEYLLGGNYLTFGGDDHYDPDTCLDTLHDLRIQAWSVWSIPPQDRPKAAEQLTRGLAKFNNDTYLEFRTPVTGTRWSRDRTIFDYYGVIDYDMEWYNGMNLAGLWSWAYFLQDPKADAFLRKRWPLVRKIANYMLALSDWSLQGAWTCARGEVAWIDGINYAYEGLLGWGALARRLGKKEDAHLADYLAAKAEAFIWTSWNSLPYFKQFAPKSAWPYPNPLDGCVGGYFEGRYPWWGEETQWPMGTWGYGVRELLVLLKDMDKKDMIARAMEQFGQNFPDWRTDPYKYAKPSGIPGSDIHRTVHHYFLDPRLMACALVLGEDVNNILRLQGAPLTGPVLECLLVGMAPRVLVPRDVRFGGCVWDDAAKTLAVTLDGQGSAAIGILPPGKPSVKAGEILRIEEAPNRTWYTVKLAGQTDIVLQF